MEKKKCFVIGYPLSHTLSPAMHNANFAKLGIECVYVARELRKEELAGFLEELRQEDAVGANVTIPYKEEVMKYLDGIDETARKIGAVNTIVNRKGRLIGHNTDWVGAKKAIEGKVKIKGKKCVVLGAGGAARAVCFALASGGAAKVIVANRTREKAAALAKEMEKKTEIKFEEIGLNGIGKAAQDAALIINCTSIGMKEGECPVDADVLHKGMAVFDLVYNPMETKLILEAKGKGCEAITGERMLLFQGAEAFKLWFGREADLEAMEEALLHEIEKRKNIVLIGMMGSGKTSVGMFLAKKMKREFVDMDKMIERKTEMNISEIFEKKGERFFRDIESDVAKEAALMRSVVISCGGGVVLREGNMKELKRNGIVFYLEADAETLAKRVREGKGRPLLEGRKAKGKLEEILKGRRHLYEKYADDIVKVRKEKEKMAGEILERLRIKER